MYVSVDLEYFSYCAFIWHWMNSAVVVRMWILCMLTTGGHRWLQLGLDVDADVRPRPEWAVLHQPAVQSPRDAVKCCPWWHRKKAGGCAACSLQLVEGSVRQWKQTACTVHYTLKFNPTTPSHYVHQCQKVNTPLKNISLMESQCVWF